MTHRSYIFASFAVTFCLHAVICLVLYRLLSQKPEIIALFRSGESGLTFVTPEPSVPLPEPEKAPPAAEPDPDPDPIPEPETPKQAVAPLTRPDVAVAPVDVTERKPGHEGDSADKGAESSYVGLTSIWPRYPLGARMRGEEGVVTVKVRVNGLGRAEHVEILKSSGYKLLDNAAEDAVKKASFAARDNSNPAGAEFTFPIRFKLKE